jgi:radical SAM protein with 4Fe4S-binding SPASM domain
MEILNKKPALNFDSIIRKERNGRVLLIDSQKPNWVVVSPKLAEIILTCDGKKTVQEIINEINKKYNTDISNKLKTSFEKLYKLKFFTDGEEILIKQSETLDGVYFNLTKRCNLRCVYCYTSAGDRNIGEKDLNFWIKIIDQLVEINNKATINFTGGEPTLYNNFWDIVKYAKDRGLKLTLITNGTNFKEEDIKKYIENFSSVEISIDSLREEINSLTRGKNSLFTSQRFVDALIENGIRPTIMAVVSKLNANYLKDFIEKYGKSASVRFQPMYKMGRGEKLDQIAINGSEYYEILNSINISKMKDDISYKRNMKYVWCGMGRNVLSIEANGIVYPCQLMHNENFVLGDLNEQSLKEIWEKSPYRKVTLNDIEECKNCEIKHICSAPCRARAFYLEGDIYKKDPLCPDFIKRSIYDNLWES